MKIIKRIILVLVIICLLLLCWLAVIRAKLSNDLKSPLFSLLPNGNMFKIYTWSWNTISYITEDGMDGIEIPVDKEKNFKFRLRMYDETWNKLNYIIRNTEREEWDGRVFWYLEPIFKDSILWMKEYKIAKWAITKIGDDTFELSFENFDYTDVNGADILYKVFWKWKVDSIYFHIWHWKNVRIEFSILDENWEIRQDYLENINTEEKRRLWCEKEAIARLQKVDPAAELIWIEWTENEEVGEQYWMITIISRKFVVRFNKNWYQWEMPDLCQANFTNWELSTMASQAYMIIE